MNVASWLRAWLVETAPRPAIERYVRCTVTHGIWTVEPGIEWREGDVVDQVTLYLRELADIVLVALTRGADPIAASRCIELTLASTEAYADRAFFVEVHDAHGRWTQTYQPYGVPRSA